MRPEEPLSSAASLESYLWLMSGLAREALSCRSPDEFWPSLAEYLCIHYNARRLTCYTVEGDEVRSVYAQGLDIPVVVRIGEGIAGHVARTRQAYITNDPYSDPHFSSRYDQITGFKTESILGAAFTHEGRSVGVIELFNKPRGFTEADARSFTWLASQVGFIIAKLLGDQKRREREAEAAQSEKLASLGLLLGGIVHDLNNPIFVIGNAAEMLGQSLPAGSPERENAELILEAYQRCAGMIKSLLDFVRRGEATPAAVSLRAELTNALTLTANRLRSGRIQVEDAVPEGLPQVLAAKDQLLQVLLNLIVNAAQAMPKGGKLKFSAAVEAGQVRLDVSDTGVGIEPQDLARLFTPFFTTKAPGEGTGLGLSTARHIVERYGGSLSGASAGKRQGACFTVKLKKY